MYRIIVSILLAILIVAETVPCSEFRVSSIGTASNCTIERVSAASLEWSLLILRLYGNLILRQILRLPL